MNRVNTRCLIVWQLTQQPSPVFAHKYFSCPRMSSVNRIFITFAFVFMPLGVIWVVSSHLGAQHYCQLYKKKSDKHIYFLQTMTNFICQYSKPIFCQFNIMFLLDRATLTTYSRSSEKDFFLSQKLERTVSSPSDIRCFSIHQCV